MASESESSKCQSADTKCKTNKSELANILIMADMLIGNDQTCRDMWNDMMKEAKKERLNEN